MLAATTVEVGAHGDDDGAGLGAVRGGEQRVDEGRALALVVTEREDLLELVDDDEPVLRVLVVRERGLECWHRVFAGPHRHQHPGLAARQDATGELGEQARAQRGGLAAPRRSHDPQQARAGQPGEHLADEALAPEEEPGIVEVEGSEAPERARDFGRWLCVEAGALAQDSELDDVTGELVFGAPEPEALGGGSASGHPQALGGRCARPLSGELVCERGEPVAAGDQLVGRDCFCVARVQRGNRFDVASGQRPERNARRVPDASATAGSVAVATASTGLAASPSASWPRRAARAASTSSITSTARRRIEVIAARAPSPNATRAP